MSDERRLEERAPITLEVQYKRLNTFFADYTKNISRGGTFIRTNKPLPIGTEFVFVLALPESATGEATRVELQGVVRWVVSTEEGTDDKPAGMGIRFVFQDDEQRAGIEALVEDLMNKALGPVLTAKLLGDG